MKAFLSDRIYEALHKAGVFPDDPRDVARVVIDLKAGSVATVYVQRQLDEKVIDVLLLGAVEIVERET